MRVDLRGVPVELMMSSPSELTGPILNQLMSFIQDLFSSSSEDISLLWIFWGIWMGTAASEVLVVEWGSKLMFRVYSYMGSSFRMYLFLRVTFM